MIVYSLREMAGDIKGHQYMPTDFQHPVSAAEHFIDYYQTFTRLCGDINNDVWHSEFCHRLMATIPLARASIEKIAQKAYASSTLSAAFRTPTEARARHMAAITALRDFLRNTNTPQHVGFAQAVLAVFRPSFLES